MNSPSLSFATSRFSAPSFFPKLAAIFWLLFGEFLFFVAMNWHLSNSRFLQSLDVWLIAEFYMAAALCGLIAYGWWMRRAWGRQLSLAVFWLALAVGLGIWLGHFLMGWNPPPALGSIIYLAIPAPLALFYLHRRAAKQLFTYSERPKPQFSISGLLVFTVVVALTLSIAKRLVFHQGFYEQWAIAQARRGDFAGAEQILSRRLASPERRTTVWRIIAFKLVEDRNVEGILRLIQEHRNDLYDNELEHIEGNLRAWGTTSDMEKFLDLRAIWLIQKLKSEKPETRKAGIYTLLNSGPVPDEVVAALKNLLNDPDPGVRNAAAKAYKLLQSLGLDSTAK